MNNKEFYINNFETFEKKLNGDSKSFLHKIRRQAVHKFGELAFPTTRNEEWKYTDISPLLKQNFIPAINSKLPEVSEDVITKLRFKDFDCHLLVFINGLYNPDLSVISELPTGVIVSNLACVAKENSELLKKHFSLNSKIENVFTALNSTFSSDGLVIIVPDGIILEKPVQVLFINSSMEELTLSQPRNLIVAGKNSQVSVITSYSGIVQDTYFSNIVTEVSLDENAIADFYKIQNESNSSYHIEKVQAHQKKSSVFNHYNIAFGGSIVRNDISSVLDDENIETHYYGLYLANGNQHIDNHTFVDHAKPNCMSNEIYKGILDDNSSGVFNGKIIVRQDAQKTNAYQQNKTILLSKTAKIDTKPQLEIFADDVKCSHGATVGHLDDVSEFYIRSRGVPQELAKSMLIRAFANDVIEKVKIDALKEQLNHMIFEHLHRVAIENE